MEPTVTPREAARTLHVTPRTIYNWIAEGKLAAHRVSKRVTRIPLSEVERLAAPSVPNARALFWDVDPGTVDERRQARFIIRRILEAGRPEHLAWMFDRYESDLIEDVAANDQRLPRRVAVAWSEILRRRRERVA